MEAALKENEKWKEHCDKLKDRMENLRKLNRRLEKDKSNLNAIKMNEMRKQNPVFVAYE